MSKVRNCTTCYGSVMCYKYHKSRYDKYHSENVDWDKPFNCPYYEEEIEDDE